MSEPQRNKVDVRDYPTGKPMKFVVTIMGKIPHGDGPDGSTIIGGAVVGPFDTREETMDFIKWFEESSPSAAGRTIIGSAQLLAPEDFKQAIGDVQEKKRLKETGHLHS